MEYSAYREIVLTSEPGWGVAFVKNGLYVVHNQSLYWLWKSGLIKNSGRCYTDSLAGCDIVSCAIPRAILESFIAGKEIELFRSDNECRWVLPEPVSEVRYKYWFASVLVNTYKY
ncbi:hypothetical protein [Shewanella algae]|uniref:hypothetical protein n=1 Tax=Shewanella algae TaxID=38313 RepID=UPI0031F56DD5